jgi:hypothetical protein
LNQTSAILSPRYFKAAHCFDGGCSKKFTPHLPPLGTNHDGPFNRLIAPHCNTDPGRGKDRWRLEVRLPLGCVGDVDRRRRRGHLPRSVRDTGGACRDGRVLATVAGRNRRLSVCASCPDDVLSCAPVGSRDSAGHAGGPGRPSTDSQPSGNGRTASRTELDSGHVGLQFGNGWREPFPAWFKTELACRPFHPAGTRHPAVAESPGHPGESLCPWPKQEHCEGGPRRVS